MMAALLTLCLAAATPTRTVLPQDDPYLGLGPARDRCVAGRPTLPPRLTADCLGVCDALVWTPRAPVISVGALNDGVEGAAAGVIGGQIYVSHGYSFGDVANLRIYDIATDTWSLGPSALVNRSEGGGAALNGKLYSIGGRVGITAVEIYDPIAMTWTSGAPMPTGRKGIAVGILNGRIHVVGGTPSGSGPNSGIAVGTHEVYDPATDTWSTAAPMPQALADVYSSVVIAGKLYVFGGWDGATVVNATWIYDPATDLWSSGAPMPTPRSNAIAGTLAGRAIVIGGLDGFTTNLDLVEVYDPATDSWCTGPSKPTPSSELGVQGIGTPNAIFAIGSGALGASQRVHEVLELLSSGPIPAAAAGAAPCDGGSVVLDGAGSQTGGCAGGLEYQWSEGPTVLCPWSLTPTCAAVASGTRTFTLEVRCAGNPSCLAPASIDVTAVPYPSAVLAPVPALCAGGSATLDASGSAGNGCAVPLEYQFRDGATVLQAWSTVASYGPFAPGAGTSYTVDVRCTATPGCEGSASQPVEVVPYPTAVLAALPAVCAGASVTLDASGSAGNGCAVPLEYQFRDGATVLQAWSTVATYGPFVPGTSTSYTVDVRCTATSGTPGCEGSTSQPVEVVPYPTAALAAIPAVCAGASITLDASGSAENGCTEPLEYQFRDGATVLQAWSTVATYGPFAPAAGTTYTVDVRCTSTPGCSELASSTSTVVPLPSAQAGGDRSPCQNDATTLDGSASSAPGCAGGALYEWRDGATVVRPASPVPTWSPPTTTVGVTTYTLVVTCASLPACEDQDDVVVTVRFCPMAVTFGTLAARRDGSAVAVEWTTLAEHGTLGFVVERLSAAGEVWEAVAQPVEAVGPGFGYRVRDESAPSPAGARWRVVELTSAGRGDVSEPFAVAGDAGTDGGGARRGRGTGRGR